MRIPNQILVFSMLASACVPVMVARPNGGSIQEADNAYDFGSRERRELFLYPLEVEQVDDRMWVVQTHRLDQPVLGSFGRSVLYVKGRFATQDEKIFLIRPNDDGTIGYIRTKVANVGRNARENFGLGKLADVVLGEKREAIEIRTFKPEVATIDVSFRGGYSVIRLPADLPPGNYVVTDRRSQFAPFAVESRPPTLLSQYQNAQQQSRLFHMSVEYSVARSAEQVVVESPTPSLPDSRMTADLTSHVVAVTPGLRLPAAPAVNLDLEMGPGIGAIGNSVSMNGLFAWVMRVRPSVVLAPLPRSHSIALGIGIEAIARASARFLADGDSETADLPAWKLHRAWRYAILGDIEWQSPYRASRFQLAVRVGGGYDVPGRAPVFRMGLMF